jgi:hypothetical protein
MAEPNAHKKNSEMRTRVRINVYRIINHFFDPIFLTVSSFLAKSIRTPLAGQMLTYLLKSERWGQKNKRKRNPYYGIYMSLLSE